MKDKIESIKPYMSLMVIIFSLLVIVFCKMEVRRLGYTLWKETKIAKEIKDELRLKSLKHASLSRPERIESMAKKLWALEKPKAQQIVQLNTKIMAN